VPRWGTAVAYLGFLANCVSYVFSWCGSMGSPAVSPAVFHGVRSQAEKKARCWISWYLLEVALALGGRSGADCRRTWTPRLGFLRVRRNEGRRPVDQRIQIQPGTLRGKEGSKIASRSWDGQSKRSQTDISILSQPIFTGKPQIGELNVEQELFHSTCAIRHKRSLDAMRSAQSTETNLTWTALSELGATSRPELKASPILV